MTSRFRSVPKENEENTFWKNIRSSETFNGIGNDFVGESVRSVQVTQCLLFVCVAPSVACICCMVLVQVWMPLLHYYFYRCLKRAGWSWGGKEANVTVDQSTLCCDQKSGVKVVDSGEFSCQTTQAGSQLLWGASSQAALLCCIYSFCWQACCVCTCWCRLWTCCIHVDFEVNSHIEWSCWTGESGSLPCDKVIVMTFCVWGSLTCYSQSQSFLWWFSQFLLTCQKGHYIIIITVFYC